MGIVGRKGTSNIVVGATVGTVEGLQDAISLIERTFEDHEIPLKIKTNSREIKAELIKLKKTIDDITPAGSPEKVISQSMEALVKAGESFYKLKMKYMPEDEEANAAFWKTTSISITSATEAIKQYSSEADKIINKMHQSIGNPKEMKAWSLKLETVKSKIIELGEIMDEAEARSLSRGSAMEKRGITRSGSKYASETIKGINQMESLQFERNETAFSEKKIKSLDRLKRAYVEYYKIVFNKNLSEKAKQQILAEKDKVIKASKKAIIDLHKSIGDEPDVIRAVKGELAKTRRMVRQEEKFKFETNEANEQSRTYLSTLEKLYNTKINIAKADASMSKFGTKKKETAEYIESLKKEEKALESKAEKQKKTMIAGGMSKQEAELRATAERKYNIEVAKSNAKGKEQMTVLQDIAHGFKQAAARVVNYTVVYRSLWFVIGLGKQAVQTIKELNEAMVNIRMVTGGTVESNMKLMQTYNQLAIQLGATTSEVSRAAIEYLRQGRSVADTNKLIEASMILSKVGSIDSASATEYLTSTMNGYKMEVSDVMRMVDAMSQVDIKAATSVQELAVGLQRSANSGRNAGVEFERLLGYIGSVSETTRRSAETIGEAFKTMFARMQNIKVGKFVDDETSEPLNDVEKSLNKLNIQLRTSENVWRPLGSVLDDINERWDSLNQTEKSAIAVSIAGIRQREIFLALMDSYDRALVLEQEALNSGGAAMQKYQAYQDGIAAAQNRLKATFESMVFTNFNQTMYKLIALDLPKVFLDVAKALKLVELGAITAGITFLSMAVDKAKSSFALLTQTMALYQNQAGIEAVKQTFDLAKANDLVAVSNYAKQMSQEVYNKAQLRSILLGHGVAASMVEQILAQEGLTFAQVKGVTVTNMLTFSMKALGTAIKTNPIFWAAAAIQATLWIFDALTVSMEEQVEKVQDLSSEISELQQEYDALKEKTSLNKSEEIYLNLLERQLVLREELLKIEKEELFLKAFRQRQAQLDATADNSSEIVYVTEDNKRSILKKDMQDIYDLYEKISDPNLDKKQYDKLNKQLVELETNYSKAVIALMNAREAGIELNESEEELVANYSKFVAEYKNKAGAAADALDSTESTALAISNAAKEIETFKEGISDLSSVLGEFIESGSLSAQTVLDLASKSSDLLQYITLENGEYKLNAAALRTRFELMKANTLASLISQQAMFKNADALRTQRDEYIKLAMATTDATQAMTYYALIAALNNDIADNSGWDTLNSTIKLIEGMTFESFIGGANSSSAGVDKLQKKIDKLNDTLKEQEELLDKLKEKNEAILDAILKVIDDELEALDTQKEETEKLYDDQISALEDSIDLIKEQADEEDRLLKLEEARLDVIKKQQALSDVLAQKNTRVYKTGLGWVFDVDPAAVKSAEEDLEESQNNYDELLKEMERDDAIKAIQDQIDALENARDAAVTLIEEQIEALKDLKEQWADSLKIEADLTQYEGALEFLAEFESASYTSRLAMMTSFKSQYASQYDAYMSQINDTKAALAELEKQQDKVNAKNGGGNFKIDEVDPAAKQAEEDAARKIIWNGLVQKAREHYTNKDYEEMGEVTAKLRALLQSDPGFYSQGIDPNVKGWEMFKQFRQGGNVSYTGPAMVHGTPSKPEFMLNAQELPIVRNLFAKMGLGGNSFQRTPMSNGSNTFVINELNVSAPNEATIETILQSAMMLAKTGRG